MALPSNLESLHGEEERIRTESLEWLESTSNLKDHLSAIHASMDIVFALVQGHKHQSNDEKVIQYLGLRVFNNCASGLKLGLSGYYQSAFALVRDVYETVLLLDYFRSNPEEIGVWESSDRKTRLREFSPAAIRKKLDKRDGYSSQKRKQLYDRLSEYASHATAPGFVLVAPQGLGKIGPFFEQKYLQAYIEEIVKYVTHAGVLFIGFFPDVEENVLLDKAHFVSVIDEWQGQYLTGGRRNAT